MKYLSPRGVLGVFAGIALCLGGLAACDRGGPKDADTTQAEASRPAPGVETVSATIAKYRVETVAEGLVSPWGLALLPGGDMLITERGGALRRAHEGRLLPDGLTGLPEVLVYGQGGLLDLALHPDFAANGLVYLSYVVGTEEDNHLAVARARLGEGGLEGLSEIYAAKGARRGGENFGGALLFLPDGTLLIAVGDGGPPGEEAQGLMTHLGKVIRLNDDGTVPADNPFLQSQEVTPEIWTFGHRNIQGLAYDPATQRVYASEHGPRGGDELNILRAGHNYGWPAISYGRDESGVAVSPFTEQEGMEQPLLYWTPAIAPAGLVVSHGAAFPGWEGDILVASLVGRQLRRVAMAADGTVRDQEMLLSDEEVRLRSVRQAPDGTLYVLTDGPDAKLLHIRAD